MTPFGVAAGRGAAGRAGLSVAVGRWDAGAGAVSAFGVAAGRGAAVGRRRGGCRRDRSRRGSRSGQVLRQKPPGALIAAFGFAQGVLDAILAHQGGQCRQAGGGLCRQVLGGQPVIQRGEVGGGKHDRGPLDDGLDSASHGFGKGPGRVECAPTATHRSSGNTGAAR